MGFGWYKLIHGIREAKYALNPPPPSSFFLFLLPSPPNRGLVGAIWAILRSWKEYGLLTWNDSELAREKMWARIHLIPVLQAEEDRDQVRRYYADQAREKELLGGNYKPYHSDR